MRLNISSMLKIFLGIGVLCIAGCSYFGAINTGQPALIPTRASPSAAEEAPTLLPFAGKIAFIYGDPLQHRNHIYVMYANGSKLMDITPPNLSEIHGLSWSPDGLYIAFYAVKDDVYQIFKVKSDGSAFIQLTFTKEGASLPSWSPDGENIMFESFSRDILGIIDLSNQKKPVPQIYIMSSDGTEVRRFTVKTKADNTPMEGSYRKDGLIAVSEPFTFHASSNYIVNSEGIIQNQFPEFSTDSPIAWSPDGTFVAYTPGREIPGCFGIVMMKFDQSEQGCLMDQKINSPIYFALPSWSPDGKYIIFSSNLDGNWNIYVIRPDGSGLTRLTYLSSDAGEAVWSAGP